MKANFVIFAPCFKHLLKQKDIRPSTNGLSMSIINYNSWDYYKIS